MSDIYNLLLMHPFILLLIGFIFGLITKNFLPAYASEKGKNLAQIEDIGHITSIIEQIKHDNSIIIENTKHYRHLSTSIMDVRIKIYQEAFYWWAKIMRANDEGEINDLLSDSSDWWNKKCLYLDSTVRDEFLKMSTLRRSLHQTSDVSEKSEILNKLYVLPNAIFEAINLPPITPEAFEKMKANK
nr:hypothetical protein [uncultured Tolumonas sp.]